MAAAHAADRLVAVHSEVKRACDLLVAASPEALESSLESLQRAVFEMSDLQIQVQRTLQNADARPLAYALRAEIMRASRLLQSLASFYSGWERILGTMSAGYTACGNPAPVARHGRLCCRG